jgi:hypothetical protein
MVSFSFLYYYSLDWLTSNLDFNAFLSNITLDNSLRRETFKNFFSSFKCKSASSIMLLISLIFYYSKFSNFYFNKFTTDVSLSLSNFICINYSCNVPIIEILYYLSFSVYFVLFNWNSLC